MKTIHTFGDSHSMYGWDKINLPDVQILIEKVISHILLDNNGGI